jgi:hypothetical protein
MSCSDEPPRPEKDDAVFSGTHLNADLKSASVTIGSIISLTAGCFWSCSTMVASASSESESRSKVP